MIEDGVVLDNRVEVSDTLDSAFEELRFQALLAHFQLEDLKLLCRRFLLHDTLLYTSDCLQNGINLFLANVTDALV